MIIVLASQARSAEGHSVVILVYFCILFPILHSGAVDGTIALQQEGPGLLSACSLHARPVGFLQALQLLPKVYSMSVGLIGLFKLP